MRRGFNNKTYLTPGGLKKLKKEYETLVSVKRLEIAKKIQDARDMGSLDDNLLYDSALDELAFVEGRINEIEGLLKNVVVVEREEDSKFVQIGSTVVVEVEGEVDELTLVGSGEADPAKNKISYESPVGKSLLGKKVGDVVVVKTEVFTTKYRIVEIK